MQILQEIIARTQQDLVRTKELIPPAEVERLAAQAPACRGFTRALREGGFGLIAEIKERSPSMGEMNPAHVAAAPAAYQASPVVKALSVLTDQPYFGGSLAALRRIREQTTKPILRKDFLVDPYQIYEARAAGADAILLMANVLSRETMQTLHDLAQDLGMDALCEIHAPEEIERLPPQADLIGINARRFKDDSSAETFARSRANQDHQKDFTVHFDVFDLFDALPAQAIKVAESGMRADNLSAVLGQRPFHAGLVGTSLLQSPDGPQAELARFARAIETWQSTATNLS